MTEAATQSEQVIGAATEAGARSPVPILEGSQAGAGHTQLLTTIERPTAETSAANDGGEESSQPEGPSYVYALGRIEPRWASPDVEKEFEQAAARLDTAGLSDRQALHAVISDSSNRYLVRHLRWLFLIEGVETYLVVPHSAADQNQLVESVRPAPRDTDVDVLIGTLGPIAPPEVANGLAVRVAIYDQLYSFDIDSLIKAFPKPSGVSQEKFEPIAEELYSRIIQLADNAGATDEHRALNYLAVRYPSIYAQAAELYGRNSHLASVTVQRSRLSGVRRIVDVIFTYTSRDTDVHESFFVRCDVSGQWPYLVTKLSPYYWR